MEHLVKLLCLAMCICTVQLANGHPALEEEDYRRALEALRIFGRVSEEEHRSIVDCKAKGDSCTGIIHCCGTLQCYWEAGYSAMKMGECVTCVNKTEKCQRDSQCCGSLQCNKGNALWVDGTCEIYRRDGDCYRDGQCVNNCNKSWWQTHGTCE